MEELYKKLVCIRERSMEHTKWNRETKDTMAILARGYRIVYVHEISLRE